MTERAPIRVVIADPFPVMVEGLGLRFADAGDLVLIGSALHAAALWSLLATTAFDVLVINAPTLGGVALLRDLVARYPRSVIVCTALMNYTAAMMAVGAHGYVTTQESAAVFKDTIRAVAHGNWVRSPLAEDCWQWYLEHGETLTPAQAQAALGGFDARRRGPTLG